MRKSIPASLGAKSKPAAAPAPLDTELVLEHLSDAEGWAVLDARGHQLNPPTITAQALAYYLRRHQLARRVTNLDQLPFQLQTIALSKR